MFRTADHPTHHLCAGSLASICYPPRPCSASRMGAAFRQIYRAHHSLSHHLSASLHHTSRFHHLHAHQAARHLTRIDRVDQRAIVECPTAIRALGTRDVYASSFGPDGMMRRDANGNAILQVNHMKMFAKATLPSAELIEKAMNACEEVGRTNFYAL